MPKYCPDCKQGFPDFVDFCVADGSRLLPGVPAAPDEAEPKDVTRTEEMSALKIADGGTCIPGRARLYTKLHGVTQPYALEFFGDVVLGRFEPDAGVVDIDLSDVPGSETISPQHAKLTFQDGHWSVEDLGSDNGVFINRGPRLTEPALLKSGDELALGNALFDFEADVSEPSED